MLRLSLKPIVSALVLLWSFSGLLAQQNQISTAIPEVSESFRNLVYKKINDSSSLKLDLFLPKNVQTSFPVVIHIHGGAWVEGNKAIIKGNYIEKTILKLLESGIAVVSIDYRLAGEKVHFPAPLEDCKDAIRWIRKNAPQYHLDPENIGLWGASAGAHLALMSAFTQDHEYPGDRALSGISAKVNYIVDDYGPTDLNRILMTDAGIFKRFLAQIFYPKILDIRRKLIFALTGNSLRYQPETVKRILRKYSPVFYTKNAVPVWINQGTKDKIVPLPQSEVLAKNLLENGISCTLNRVENEGHNLPNLTNEEQLQIAEKISGFVIRNLKNTP